MTLVRQQKIREKDFGDFSNHFTFDQCCYLHTTVFAQIIFVTCEAVLPSLKMQEDQKYKSCFQSAPVLIVF